MSHGTSIRQFFSERLRALRIAKGFPTARKFAQKLGIDENRYTRYERAEVEPDLALLVRICAELSASPNDLLGSAAAAGTPGFNEPSEPPLAPPPHDDASTVPVHRALA